LYLKKGGRKVMRRLLALVVAGILLVGVSGPLFAGSYKAMGIGTRALSKGGAFIGQADDWTALYWNPAGLAQLKGVGAGIEPHYLHCRQYDGNSAKNYDVANYSAQEGDAFPRMYPTFGAGNEPAQFTTTSAVYSDLSSTSSVGGYFNVNDTTIALGRYTPAAVATRWEDTVNDVLTGAPIHADLLASTNITAYNLSLGHQINPFVSVGAGVNYLYEEVIVDVGKTYEHPTLGYVYDVEEKGTGDGCEGVVGILTRPHEKLGVGAVYRSGAKVKMDGNAHAINSLLGLYEDSDYSMVYHYPASYGVGLAYYLSSRWNVTLDWERTEWHVVERELDYSRDGGTLLIDTKTDFGYKDSDQVRLGTEYQINSKWAWRSGVILDETPVPDKSCSVTNLVDTDKIILLSGVGYRVGRFGLDAGYGYGYGRRHAQGVHYELDIHMAMIGASCYF
jgi:long-chain fatty acid transport protein